jgi:hypothetical protein
MECCVAARIPFGAGNVNKIREPEGIIGVKFISKADNLSEHQFLTSDKVSYHQPRKVT